MSARLKRFVCRSCRLSKSAPSHYAAGELVIMEPCPGCGGRGYSGDVVTPFVQVGTYAVELEPEIPRAPRRRRQPWRKT